MSRLNPNIASLVIAVAAILPGTASRVSAKFVFYPKRFETIELRISNSEQVIRGKLISVRPGDGIYLKIEIEVLETIFGPAPASKSIVVDRMTSDAAVLPWLNRPGAEVLLLIEPRPSRLSRAHFIWADAIPLDEPCRPGIATLDFRVMHEPAEILAAARKTAAMLAALPPVAVSAKRRLFNERNEALVYRAIGGGITAAAPLNQLLLHHAKEWVHSPSAELRACGMEAMGYFDFSEQESIMRELLHDPDEEFEGHRLWLRSHYRLREAAAQWLGDHNKTFDASLLSEPYFAPIATHHILIGGGVAVIMIVICRALARFSKRFAGRKISAVFVAMMFASLLLALGHALSWERTYEISLNSGSTLMAVLRRGEFLFMNADCDINPPGLSRASYRTRWCLNRWTPGTTAAAVSPLLPGVSMENEQLAHPLIAGRKFNYRTITLPLWPLVLLGIMPFAIALGRSLRHGLRVRRGQCVHCGFDLRASGERCPECGQAVGTNYKT